MAPDGVPSTVFLDRDGTLNRKAPDGEYVTSPDDLVLLPGAARAVRRLNDAGVRVVLVTNQRGVARGLMSADDYRAVHGRLCAQLAAAGAHLDAAYACFHEQASCACRKPQPGLLLRAAAEDPAIRLEESALVGDSCSDIEAGRAAGVLTVLLAEATSGAARPCRPDAVAPDLAAAVTLLLTGRRAGGQAGSGKKNSSYCRVTTSRP